MLEDLLRSMRFGQLHSLHGDQQEVVDYSVCVVSVLLLGDRKVPVNASQEFTLKLVQFLKRDAAYFRDVVVAVENIVKEL